jgi:hypothetical protein
LRDSKRRSAVDAPTLSRQLQQLHQQLHQFLQRCLLQLPEQERNLKLTQQGDKNLLQRKDKFLLQAFMSNYLLNQRNKFLLVKTI